MKPVKTTVEILAFKALNRSIDQFWVNWAIDMLTAGYDTEHLKMLAVEIQPFNQFEMQMLTDKVLDELQLSYNNKDQIIKNYVSYLIDKSLNGELNSFSVLSILKDIYLELDCEEDLEDFNQLYFAKDDLFHSPVQWYWHGATQENIDDIIIEYFKK
uniref:hypothetical protein n=1 Tax=uncultured Acinetobacter sp. TaxID=165433 RepID=UPI0026224C3F|nr:hypothetical protein [uncultured Acinetobacter sp.]